MRAMYEHATPEQRKLGATHYRPSDGALLNASGYRINPNRPVRVVPIDIEVLDKDQDEALCEWLTRVAR